MHEDLLYQLALTNVRHVGPVQARILCEHFECARDIFRASRLTLERIEKIGSLAAQSIKSFNNFHEAEKEINFIERYHIEPLFIKDKKYPQRLLNCDDPPTLLFYKGTADLNTEKIISIVGTRRNSEYGRMVVEKLLSSFSKYEVLVVSGLAYGIDSIAHSAALKNNLQTIGVIAHGMDIIYPPENIGLAKEMLLCGGLLTEFKSFTKPDKFNFPGRNRIVAGMSDATIIIESDEKGGSMITADLAHGYNRDVFAVPGRITESRSRGCNALIENNKAHLIKDFHQVPEMLGWKTHGRKSNSQKELFIELSKDEKQIFELLQDKQQVSLEELNICCKIPASLLASALLNLEIKNLVKPLPGKKFQLIG